jgi:hypothetical protein
MQLRDMRGVDRAVFPVMGAAEHDDPALRR